MAVAVDIVEPCHHRLGVVHKALIVESVRPVHDTVDVVHANAIDAISNVGRRIVLARRARRPRAALVLLLVLLVVLLVMLLRNLLVLLRLLHLNSLPLLLRYTLSAHHHGWVGLLLVTRHGHALLTLDALHLALWGVPVVHLCIGNEVGSHLRASGSASHTIRGYLHGHPRLAWSRRVGTRCLVGARCAVDNTGVGMSGILPSMRRPGLTLCSGLHHGSLDEMISMIHSIEPYVWL